MVETKQEHLIIRTWNQVYSGCQCYKDCDCKSHSVVTTDYGDTRILNGKKIKRYKSLEALNDARKTRGLI